MSFFSPQFILFIHFFFIPLIPFPFHVPFVFWHAPSCLLLRFCCHPSLCTTSPSHSSSCWHHPSRSWKAKGSEVSLTFPPCREQRSSLPSASLAQGRTGMILKTQKSRGIDKYSNIKIMEQGKLACALQAPECVRGMFSSYSLKELQYYKRH